MENTRFFTFRERKMYYRIYGTGKPVVLIHGFAEDGNIWNHLIKQLENRFMLIVPDLPGSGRSQMLEEGDVPITIDDYADVIIRILKEEGISDCTAIGHSMGGYITLAMADNHPGLLNGLGLFHSTAFADTEEKKKDRLKSLEPLQKEEVTAFLKKSMPALFAAKFKEEHVDEIEGLINSLTYFTGKALIQYQIAMMNRPDRTHVLRATTLPVLFITGEEDKVVTLQQALAQCHLPQISHVHILKNSGHMGMLEQRDLSAGLVSSYLEAI